MVIVIEERVIKNHCPNEYGKARNGAYTGYYDLSLLSTSIYPAVIIPAGSATTAIPKIEEIIVIMRPAVVTG